MVRSPLLLKVTVQSAVPSFDNSELAAGSGSTLTGFQSATSKRAFPAEDLPMNETTSHVQVPRCPYCGGKQFLRSRRRGFKDSFLHYVLFQNPYPCGAGSVFSHQTS